MKKNTSKAKTLFDAREFLTKFRSAYDRDLKSVSSPDLYQLYSQERWLGNFDKKYLLPGDKATRENLAFAKFSQVNAEMGLFNETFQCGLDIELDRLIECTKHTVGTILGPLPSLEEIFIGCKNSNGTSIGVPFWNTNPERKFKYPISMTESVGPLWEEYLRWDKDLAHAIELLNEESLETVASVTVAGSRACTVPKSNDIDRMIAVEPVVNMWFQHGVSSVMEAQLKKVGLSFERDQEKHRSLAWAGSIHNRLATVDFSSMSDRVSLKVCQMLLPGPWFSLLCLIRSPQMSLRTDRVSLNMISTMGNATTFPLETLLLWSLARSCMQITNSRYRKIPDWTKGKTFGQPLSVFGDDCIMPSLDVPLFLKLCSYVGFVPNKEKSFWGEENFRESCGGDFYHGRDVRPFFLSALPETKKKSQNEAWLYTTINGVIRNYIKYFGTVAYLYDRALLRFLFSCLKSVTDKVKFVPENFPDDSGITCLNDRGRFLKHYSRYLKYENVSPIWCDVNGMLAFTYLRYIYPEKSEWNQRLRYALALKRLWRTRDDPTRPLDYLGRGLENNRQIGEVRKRGIYVQSRSSFQVSRHEVTTLRCVRHTLSRV